MEKILWPVRKRFADLRKRAGDRLRTMGFLPCSLEGIQPLEGAVQNALPPVEPSTGFRQALRDNLAIAAQRKMSGLVVEYPSPLRQVVILGISAGIVAATIATLVLVRRARPANAGR